MGLCRDRDLPPPMNFGFCFGVPLNQGAKKKGWSDLWFAGSFVGSLVRGSLGGWVPFKTSWGKLSSRFPSFSGSMLHMR